jgi:DNA-binding CsgD family transcriptional regulator
MVYLRGTDSSKPYQPLSKNTHNHCLIMLHAPYLTIPASQKVATITANGYRYGTIQRVNGSSYSQEEVQDIASSCGDFLSYLETLGITAWIHKNQLAVHRLNLTNREREVLTAMYEGHVTDAIAAMLTLAPRTITTYRAHLYQKFLVNHPLALIRQASEAGLFRYLND